MRTLRRHVHRQAGANCTDAKLYFWTIFQFFYYPNGTWTLPPTSKLFLDFWIFFNFAKSPKFQRQRNMMFYVQCYHCIITANTCMFPSCYKIPIGISASGPNSRCHQQNKIRCFIKLCYYLSCIDTINTYIS